MIILRIIIQSSSTSISPTPIGTVAEGKFIDKANQCRSHFLELLRLKSVRLKSNRNWMWFDIRYGTKFLYIFYMPQLFYLVISYLLTPVWRRTDERYHLRFAEGEGDDIDEIEPFVTYQQRKKPMTRRKYSDSVKLIYNGDEEYDYISEQPQRYR